MLIIAVRLVVLINHSAYDFRVERGMRIAQMVIAPYSTISTINYAELRGTRLRTDEQFCALKEQLSPAQSSNELYSVLYCIFR
jgi:hypothetical protein